jgi:hypothetical protein
MRIAFSVRLRRDFLLDRIARRPLEVIEVVKSRRTRALPFLLTAVLLPILTMAAPDGVHPGHQPTSVGHFVFSREDLVREFPKEPFKALQFLFDKMNRAIAEGGSVASMEWRVERVPTLPDGGLSSLEPVLQSSGKLVLHLRLVREIADNPVLILEELVRLRAQMQTQVESPPVFIHEPVKVGQFNGHYVQDSHGHWVPDPNAPASHWHHYIAHSLTPILKAIGIRDVITINGRNSLSWSELKINATQGSRLAHRELAEIEIKLAATARDSFSEFLLLKNLNDPQKVKEAIVQVAQARGIQVNLAASLNDMWSEYYEQRLDRLKLDLEKKTAEARKELADHRKKASSPEVNAEKAEAERAAQKLNDLVKANDRLGVAKLLETFLSLETMEPMERALWQEWIDSIRNPDPANKRLLYRGIDKTDPVQKVLAHDGKEIGYGFFSTLLTKNQGNYTRRLRSYSTMRLKFGNLDQSSHTSLVEVSPLRATPKVVDMMLNHSNEPIGSPFMSFTLSPTTAYAWSEVGGGFLAVEVDARRVMPNVVSMFKSEIEMLVPLIVFPDEVVHFEKFADVQSRERTGVPEILDRVSQKLGRKIEALSPYERVTSAMYRDAYRVFGQAQNRLLVGPTCVEAFAD